MTSRNRQVAGTFVAGVALGIVLSSAGSWLGGIAKPLRAADAPKKLVDPQALAEDFEAAKGKLPDQSHAMTDVAMQFSNLWFAAEKENWPLADFFWSETRSHLAWAVRIIPKRKDNAGRVVDLVAILQSLENSPLKQLGAAIKAKDHEAFVKAYRFTIEGCYACHKAADKPYIHPQIPTAPALPIINFDPHPDWPK